MKKNVKKRIERDFVGSFKRFFSHRGRKTRSLVLLLLLLVAALLYGGKKEWDWQSEQAQYADRLQIHFIDVGQGDAALLRLPSGETMLIDCGPSDAEPALTHFLHAQRIRTIDFAVFTHPHEDHIGNAEAVLEACKVKNVLLPDIALDTPTYRAMKKAMDGEAGLSTHFAVSGQQYQLGELSFTVLAPNSDFYEEENDTSIVLRIEYKETSFLFTGDAEAFSEREILAQYSSETLDCDLLKVGHHGSDTSTSVPFLEAVTPDIAVISCERNNEYGHPHADVLTRLKQQGAVCLRTDELGNILILSDGSSLILP